MRRALYIHSLKHNVGLWAYALVVGIAVLVAQSHARASTGVAATSTVAPTLETQPMPHADESADDPAIWIHGSDPNQSRIIGTDKQGGLAVYDPAGQQVQYVPDGKMNNVDVRYNFALGGQLIDLVSATNQSTKSIALYRMNATGTLANIAARQLGTGIAPYGTCMYRSVRTGKHYVFVTKNPYPLDDPTVNTGEVRQFELFDNGAGKIDMRLVRTFVVGSESEGCVADDVNGTLYIAQTKVGIWKYGAEPNAGDARTSVDQIGAGHLSGELEGLALYTTSQNTGYLIVSHQCCANFVVYQREGSNQYVTTFKIGAGNGIDAVNGTDGIDVTNVPFGSGFPQGVFVAHDGLNETPEGNFPDFKLVPWQDIARSGSPTLAIDPTSNPRGGAASPPNTPTPPTTPTPTPAPLSWKRVYLPLNVK